MSSLFPFLRSLLVSPLKSDHQSASIQHTIKDRHRGGFTTPDRQQDHLSFHDTGLRASQGALIVLEALAINPFASKLTLSHNSLGDPGVRLLATRIRYLKNRRTTEIDELNLAGNSLTDLALIDLCQSWDGLSELYLSNNQIQLTSVPSPMLMLGNLTLLSLTSNPINCASLANLFRNPSFSPSKLTTLHLSACSLDLSVAVSLAIWLEDKSRSSRLEWLAVNGNNWGTPGCERITWVLARKYGNSNLLRVEMLACDSPVSNSQTESVTDGNQITLTEENQTEYNLMGYRDLTDLENCRLAIQHEGGWKPLLESCEVRNRTLRLATRRAALGLVSKARQILLSSPILESQSDSRNTFPWTRLPEEVKLHIWKWVSIFCAYPGLQQPNGYLINVDSQEQSFSLYSRPSSPSQMMTTTNSNGSGSGGSFEFTVQERHHGRGLNIPEPLSSKQLIRLLNYAQDRNSLQMEIEEKERLIFNHELHLKEYSDSSTAPTFHRRLIESQKIESEINRLGSLLILKTCDCLQFQGQI